jgi:hypothetical protein
MDTLGDVLARDRRSTAAAIRLGHRETAYSYEKCLTDSWKAAHFLRYHGVRPGRDVVVAATPHQSAIVAALGAGLLGAVVRFGPDTGTDTAAIVAPPDRFDEYDPDPGSALIGFGDKPDSPEIEHFERGVWSENPTMPPRTGAPDDPLLGNAEGTWSQSECCSRAVALADELGLDATDQVALRSSLSRPGTVVAGVLAPLVAGASILLPDGEETGTVGVGSDVPESRQVDPASVF